MVNFFKMSRGKRLQNNFFAGPDNDVAIGFFQLAFHQQQRPESGTIDITTPEKVHHNVRVFPRLLPIGVPKLHNIIKVEYLFDADGCLI